MATVARATRRHLEDGVLAPIGRITTSDAMGSWIAASVTSAPRNCSQPQPALCENSPVRSWFGPGYEVFGGRVTIVEWLRIEGFSGYARREVRRGAPSGREWTAFRSSRCSAAAQRARRGRSTTPMSSTATPPWTVVGTWRTRSRVRPSSATWKSPNTGTTRPSNRRWGCRSEGRPARGPAIRPPSWTSEFRSNTRWSAPVRPTRSGCSRAIPFPWADRPRGHPARYYRQIPLTHLDTADED